MSIDRSGYALRGERSLRLDFKPGLTVVVQCDFLTGETRHKDCWKGLVSTAMEWLGIQLHNIVRIADIASGVVCWVNADLLSHKLSALGSGST